MIRETLDRRGVSEVIGSILVFGLVVLLLTIVQTQAVPSANQDVEFDHSQEVQEDVARLSGAVSQAAIGRGSSVTVATGTSYPNRLVLFNPPAPSGNLRSTDGGTVELANVRGFGAQTRDYIDGSLDYETAGLEYGIEYNRYREAPVTGFEYGVVYDRYEDGTVQLENGGSLISGRTISLTLLEGDLQRSSQRTTTVDVRPVSAPARTVQVANTTGDDLTVTLPTAISEEVWVTEILASQLDDSGDGSPGLEGDETACADLTGTTGDGDGRYVSGCSYGGDSITLTFQRLENGEPVRYDLRTAKVGFAGSTTSPTPEQYTVNVTELDRTATAGEKVRLQVEVRDEFNNPISGVQVAAVLNESNTGDPSEEVTSPSTTNEDGVATVTYTAPASGSTFVGEERTVTVTTDTSVDSKADVDALADERKVSFDVMVEGDTGNLLTGPPQVEFVQGSAAVTGPSGGDNGVQFAVRNAGSLSSSVELTAVKVAVEGDAAEILQESTATSGQWNREVFVDKQVLGGLAGGDTFAEAGGETTPPLRSYDVGDGTATKVLFDAPITLEGSDEAVYSLYAFRLSDGTTVNMHEKTVTITVYYEDDAGNEYTLTETATLPGS